MTEAVCIASGKVSPDFSRTSTILQLPNGRQFELPIEVREDGIYAHISDEVQAAIDEAVSEQNERRFKLVALGYWEWPGDSYSFAMPEKALIQQPPAPLRHPPAMRHSSGKRAQRRQSKPWADRRQLRR